MKRFCDLVHHTLGRALQVLVGVMALTVAWQVSSRLLARLCLALDWPVFIQPSRWTEELAGFQLSWVALLGAAWVLREGAHPGLDLVHQQLGPRLRRGADVLGAALVALFSVVVLVYGGLRLVLMTQQLEQRTAALGWPMAAVYSVVPVAGALLALFALEALLRSLRTPAEGQP
ncbi:MAG: TRAP transporter small permease subunit [Acidobacteriota bacterium]